VTPVVRILLFANIVAFFLQETLGGFTRAFMFVPAYVLLRPWTVVTYMFLHSGITHILFNMLGLYFFGPRLEERLGSRQFTTLYLVAGVTGAMLSLAMAFLGFSAAPIVGASGAVYGVMMGFAYYWPDTPIHIWGVLPVPARVLVIIYTVMSLLGGFSGGGGVAHFAHLGGFVGAYAYLKWLERARTSFRRQAAGPPPEVARSAAAYRTIDRSKLHELNRAEVDRILDKISAQGVGSLTPQEQLFLSNFVPPDDRKPPVQ
jgi:membrane associated rhomboid family serine protease